MTSIQPGLPPWRAALYRFLRVLAGQVVAAAIVIAGRDLSLLDLSPELTILLGAVLNMVGKYLRDRYGWEWTP